MGYRYGKKEQVLESEPNAYCKYHHGWEEFIIMTPPEIENQKIDDFIRYKCKIIGRGNSAGGAWADALKKMK